MYPSEEQVSKGFLYSMQNLDRNLKQFLIIFSVHANE